MSLVERALKKIQESRAQAPHALNSPQTSSAPALAGGPAHTVPMQPARAAAQPSPAAQAPRVSAVPVLEPVRPSRVVHIDRDALRHAELLPPLSQERQLAGEYRQIKRP